MWYLILILTLFTVFKLLEPKIKGKIGEQAVASKLFLLDSRNYKVIHDVVLKTGNRITQIDHIVISDFGIFVIETKNYKGWILGGEHSEYWTQVLFKRKEKLYNPIRQNLGHIQALQNNLRESPYIHFKSIIAFSSRATLKVNTITDVVYINQINRTIKKYEGFHLSENDKVRIFQKINQLNIRGGYNRLQHRESIRKTIQNREYSFQQKKCPLCGNNLVLRNGKFGNFWGCTSFPNCTFSRAN